MTDIVVTAAQVAPVFPTSPSTIIRAKIAAEAITKGQAVYYLSAGTAGVADANASGKQQFRGIALNAAGAGGVVDVLERGEVYGFTVSSLNSDAMLYLSDTAGALADSGGTMTVAVGRVEALSDPSKTEVVSINAYLTTWS